MSIFDKFSFLFCDKKLILCRARAEKTLIYRNWTHKNIPDRQQVPVFENRLKVLHHSTLQWGDAACWNWAAKPASTKKYPSNQEKKKFQSCAVICSSVFLLVSHLNCIPLNLLFVCKLRKKKFLIFGITVLEKSIKAQSGLYNLWGSISKLNLLQPEHFISKLHILY